MVVYYKASKGNTKKLRVYKLQNKRRLNLKRENNNNKSTPSSRYSQTENNWSNKKSIGIFTGKFDIWSKRFRH